MKSMSQLLDQQVRQMARQKVRDAIQPGVIGNVLESEMNAVLSQIVNARLVQQRDAALNRAHYEHHGDGRLRKGFKPVSLGGLFGNWSILKPVLRRGTPAYPLVSWFSSWCTVLHQFPRHGVAGRGPPGF